MVLKLRKTLLRVFVACITLLCALAFFACGKVDFKYTIDFVVDGEVVASVGTDSETISMPKNPKKDDYTFEGWFWDEAGYNEFTLNSIGDQPLQEENRFKVYAKWKSTKYYFVRFAGGNGSEEMEEQKIPVGIATPLYKVAFTPAEGEVFDGWESHLDADKRYADGESVLDLCAAGETVTLYAKWRTAYYTLRFDGNGGTIHEADRQEIVGRGVYMNKIYEYQPPVAYMVFDGWNTKADGTGISVVPYERTDIPAKEGEILVLYAQWKQNPEAEVHSIRTLADLELLKGDTQGNYYILEKNIDCGGATITPLAHGLSYSFDGTFWGNGHVISNFKMVAQPAYGNTCSFFGTIGFNGYVEGLGLENFTLTGHEVASFAVQNYGVIKNCYAKGDLYMQSDWEYFRDSMKAAGFVLDNDVNAKIENCYFAGNLTANSRSEYDNMAGFAVGGEIKGCFTVCTMSAKNWDTSWGGEGRLDLFGYVSEKSSDCYFYEGCSVSMNWASLNNEDLIAEGGQSASQAQMNTATFYTDMGWSAEIWNFGGLNVANGVLPTLRLS